jgi:ERCC4-type nuclease
MEKTLVEVDFREKDLIDSMTAAGVHVTPRGLDVGDILFRRDGVEGVEGIQLILERKKTTDLAASIKDGRWREQKTRLKESGVPAMFVVEGSLDGCAIQRRTLVSAISNTITRDSMHVIRTYSVHETCEYIQHLAGNMAVPPPTRSTLRAPRSKRCRESDPAVVYIRQLMCIPSVSETIAHNIAQEYTSLPVLQESLAADPDCLSAIHMSKARRVGRGITGNIRRAITGIPMSRPRQ